MIDRRSLILSAAALLAARSGRTQETGAWPQWRGPNRDAHSPDEGLLARWPAGGPPLIYTASGLGEGYSTPSLEAGRLYAMGYQGGREVVWARDAVNGAPAWSTQIGDENRRVGYPDGPRSTPTLNGDFLYCTGVSGDVICARRDDGRIVWRRSMTADFGGRVPRWGFAESPLVDGEQVIVTPGGPDATLVALNRATGAVIWKAAVPGGDNANYSSAVKAVIAGTPQYVQFVSGGVVAVSVHGSPLWRYDAPANGTANISTVVIQGDHVFAASGYNTGGGLVRIAREGDAFRAEEIYFTKNMQNHHGGMVLVDGYLYGFDRGDLTCLDFKTGDVKWSDRSVGKGSVTYADGRIYARSERGPVALVAAKPDAYEELGQLTPPARSGKMTWPHPVVAGGRLYLRDQDQLFCYSLRPA